MEACLFSFVKMSCYNGQMVAHCVLLFPSCYGDDNSMYSITVTRSQNTILSTNSC